MYGLKMSKHVVGRMSLVRAVLKLRANKSVLAVVRLADGKKVC